MRCFVALWPPRALAMKLDAIAAELQRETPGARRIAADDLHLTLAFIGELGAAQTETIVDALRTLPVEPFDWSIDRAGSFRGARVAWAGGTTTPQLAALAVRVRGQLDELQIPYDRKPFVPHVTLLRKVAGPIPSRSIEPLSWPVKRPPVLAASVQLPDKGTRYRCLK